VTVFAVAVGGQGYSSFGQEESDPVPNRRKPEEPNCSARVERRRQARGDVDSMDWETIALRRVERRVESLAAAPDSPLDPPGEAGWEEGVLIALRRRMRDLKAE